MSFDFGALVSPGIRLLESAYARRLGRHGRLSPSEVIAAQKKWRTEFESRIADFQRRGLSCEIIVRDVDRLDEYLKLPRHKKGISPWFRCGLVGTYHSGLKLLQGYYSLTKSMTGLWRFTDYKNGETGEIDVALIGCVPYVQIEHVDWDGDEYYALPVLFSYFDTKRREPYDRLAFCTFGTLDHPDREIEWYNEICDYDATKRYSRSVGVSSAT
jgi:hypothetical protein